MLKQDRVPAFGRIKESHPEQTLEHYELKGETDKLRGGERNNGGRDGRPYKDRQAHGSHTLRTHSDYGCDHIQRAEDGGPASSENTQEEHLHTHRCASRK